MTDSRRVIVIQHVACETLGQIEPILNRAGIVPRIVRVFQDEQVPARLEAADGLIVMGGPMGVGDTAARPHLRREMQLIESALAQQRPVLGVCLGSQLLAHVLGATVAPGARPEIGWRSVRLTDAAAGDPLWKDVPRQFQALHWHGDVFDLPRDAVHLASSEQTAHQAFRYGTNAYGMLFHMEVTAETLAGMAAAFPEELAAAGETPGQLEEGCRTFLPELSGMGERVFPAWAGLVPPPE